MNLSDFKRMYDAPNHFTKMQAYLEYIIEMNRNYTPNTIFSHCGFDKIDASATLSCCVLSPQQFMATDLLDQLEEQGVDTSKKLFIVTKVKDKKVSFVTAFAFETLELIDFEISLEFAAPLFLANAPRPFDLQDNEEVLLEIEKAMKGNCEIIFETPFQVELFNEVCRKTPVEVALNLLNGRGDFSELFVYYLILQKQVKC